MIILGVVTTIFCTMGLVLCIVAEQWGFVVLMALCVILNIMVLYANIIS